MEHKFLSDGRKVAIVGKINSEDYVVQEIFITAGGDEIPSGEKFTTKSLHDAPAESYFSREEKRQKEKIKSHEAKIAGLGIKIKEANWALRTKADMLKNSPELQDLLGDKIDVFANFVAGSIKYIVVDGYKLSAPERFEDDMVMWDYWGEKRYENLKLMTVFGKSNGDIGFRRNAYGDGSGSDTEIFPYMTHEEATAKVREFALEQLGAGRFDKKDLKLCNDLGITFNAEDRQKIIDILKKDILLNIKNLVEGVEEATASKSQYENELKALESSLGLA